MPTEVDRQVDRLAAAILRATEAAERLLKCAESISNPVYSVTMQGAGNCDIQAVRHFAGQIEITVAPPKTIEQRQKAQLTQYDNPAMLPLWSDDV
jgi:hypothetical protein